MDRIPSDIILPTWAQLRLLLPEIALILGMCAVILAPMLARRNRFAAAWAAAATLVLALVAVVASMIQPVEQAWLLDGSVLHGMLTIDPFSQFFKLLLVVFALLVLGQWLALGRDRIRQGDLPDFLCLLLGGATGMALMASSSNLLMMFIAIETASLPSYALAGFRKWSADGAEGGLKYVLFGAASSAIGVYGLSLVYGAAGSLAFADVGQAVAADVNPAMAVGLVAMFAGLAFKLSAAPMHFWCPDVFQAAPFEITTFLSVASKGAAVILLARLLHAIGLHAPALTATTDQLLAPAAGAMGIGLLGAVTATVGNVAAMRQTHLRRLLAYSSIAHAGYMIMAAASFPLLDAHAAQPVAQAILFYLTVYLFMNTGAFTVAAVIARRYGSEQLDDMAGLLRASPLLVVLMAVFLLSLFGMPGLGGFWGKVYLALGMLEPGGTLGYVLVAVLLVNTVLSLYVYLRPLYPMVFLPAANAMAATFRPTALALSLLLICAAGLLWTGLELGAGRMIRPFGVMLASQPTPSAPASESSPPRAPAAQQHIPATHHDAAAATHQAQPSAERES